MTFWAHVLNRLRAVPAGIWAAIGLATTIFGLYLRGRRLQAELVKARTDTEVAKAAAAGATDLGKAMVHLDEAKAHRAKAEVLRTTLKQIENAGADEQTRLHAMSQSQVTEAYLKRLREQKPH